jgi:hypothetical protein
VNAGRRQGLTVFEVDEVAAVCIPIDAHVLMPSFGPIRSPAERRGRQAAVPKDGLPMRVQAVTFA